MLDDFKAFAREVIQLYPQQKCLLAISGGVDSVVMADLFHQSAFRFDIVHCNFSLRGSESDKDEAFVEALAQSYGVDCIVKLFDTQMYAREQKISIQMAARNLRYVWFEQILQNHQYHGIATAHHKNDVLETMVFNLAKGTGLSGLRGMRPRQGRIFRPLLFSDKQQILEYAQQRGLKWREDSSNVEVKYQRNFIRHKVIPLLEQVNPSLFKTLDNTLERLTGAETLLEARCDEIRGRYMLRRGKHIYLQTKELTKIPGLNVIMDAILKDYGLTYPQSAAVAELLSKYPGEEQVGKVFDSETYRVNLDREQIIISPRQQRDSNQDYLIAGKDRTKQLDFCALNFRLQDAGQYTIKPDAKVAALDYAKLKFPLTLRKWRWRDIFYPLGMAGRKKLSDFLIDTKVPLNLKDQVYVLTSGEDIVWVVGYRIDHRYRITGKTRQVYEIRQHLRNNIKDS
jgi:tRNA(Ile)-lysidine synthase